MNKIFDNPMQDALDHLFAETIKTEPFPESKSKPARYEPKIVDQDETHYIYANGIRCVKSVHDNLWKLAKQPIHPKNYKGELILLIMFLLFSCNTTQHMNKIHPYGGYWTGKKYVIFDSTKTLGSWNTQQLGKTE